MAASKSGAAKRVATKPATPQQKAVAQDIDKRLEDLMHESLARSREQLRTRVMPALELVILGVPSGPARTRLLSANSTLLKALEELGA